MDNFFDDLGEFVKSIFNGSIFSSSGKTYTDPDMQEAMEELDEYLNEGKEKTNRTGYNSHSSQRNYSNYKNYKSTGNYHTKPDSELDSLKQDFANLEVPFGSPLKKVKEAYKKLLRQYHPDKHADDPEKLQIATEITKKINASFHKIKAYYKN